mgnify:FL=1|jgi:outer membrane lipopolysaccharide assembly protein LptE/RlpB|tara:strand:- start:88 stop:546 length:459 start_codon:yes stop_codon:yes gene_type:complete
MFKGKIYITLLFLLIASCGYSPIYSNLENKNLNIKVENFEGDRNINNLIKDKLNKYKSVNAEKTYLVKITTDYEKLILSKDTAGLITNYRLTSNVNFDVTYKNLSKTINVKEKFDIKKGDSLFEDQKYENLIKQNMANLSVQKFIFQLLRIE